MAYLFAVLIILFSLWGSQPVGAALMERPKVEYSADETMQTEEMTIQQHVYVTPTKDRKEMVMGSGEGMVQIFRHDTKVMWQLMPAQKMYMEHSMDKAAAQSQGKDLSQWDFEQTVVGEEMLEGVKVTKYKTIATSTDGKKFGGFSWLTKDGIPLKTDLLFKEGEQKMRMSMELKNLKIGKQDPKLFEVPEGFTKFDMAGMMGGAMMGREGRGRPGMGQPGMDGPDMSQGRPGRPTMPASQNDAPTSPEPSAIDRSEVQKAGDMMKKLFGR